MSSILGLDVGEVRVGVALANSVARLASPYLTLANTGSVIQQIHDIIDKESVDVVVVGLPRNLSGEDTDQTRYCRSFADQLTPFVKVVFQDEALTSRKAEAELQARGKAYEKGDIDSLAATYILEDFLNDKRNIL
jgi:putative Holliday junction resolvase